MIDSHQWSFQPASGLAGGELTLADKGFASGVPSREEAFSRSCGVPAARLPTSSARVGITAGMTDAGVRGRSKVLASLGEGRPDAIVSAHEARGIPPNQALQTTPISTPVLLFFDPLVRRV